MNKLSPLDRLILIKVGALLHDPPHKSWCINENVWGQRCYHEEEAKLFRRALLENTPLHDLIYDWHNLYGGVIESADRIAAGLDRWLITLLLEHRYVASKVLLNLFNPRLSVSLDDVNLEKLREKVNELAIDLNKLLSKLNKLGDSVGNYSTRLIAYIILYALLEILHYLKGLPTSLADTRVPTHTIYDHLYASASMTNLVIPEERPEVPRGFLTVVDVPGVQEFVMAARKAGDYWVASWLLSRATWKVAEKVMSVLGPDVVLSPTPRYNVSFYSFIDRFLSELEEELHKGGHEEEAKIVKELREVTIEYVSEFLRLIAKPRKSEKEDKETFLSELEGFSLTPATVIFVLPKIKVKDLDFGSAEGVMTTLKRLCEDSWKEIIDDLNRYLSELCKEERLESQGRVLTKMCIGEALFKAFKDVISKPPTGFRISVIDVEEVYNNLRKCISGEDEACKTLGKRVNTKELKTLVDEIVNKLQLRIEDVSKGIAHALLFHEALFQLMRGHALKSVPTPRPFWILVADELIPVVSLATRKRDPSPDLKDWIPCYLCGAEPAVIKLRKVTRRIWVEGTRTAYLYEDFVEEDIKGLASSLKTLHNIDVCQGLSESECVSLLGMTLKDLGIKPGEALGPYCLLKRLTYASITRDELNEVTKKLRRKLGLPTRKVPSTDDVALKAYEDSLLTLISSRKCAELTNVVCQELIRVLSKDNIQIDHSHCLESVKLIFCERESKSLEEAAFALQVGYEKLLEDLSDVIKKVLETRISEEDISRFLDFLKTRYAYELITDSLKNLISEIYKVKRGHIVDRLAEIYDGYLIVKGDADNVGLVAEGKLANIDEELECERYAEHVLKAFRNQHNLSYDEEILDKLKETFMRMCKFVKAFYGGEDKTPVIVSPSYYQTFSSALMITAIKDLMVVKGVNGLLVFSGGDDVLAILPPQRLWIVFELRSNYAGSKTRPGFHCINDKPFISAIPFGRSFSVRFAKLKDLMNEEIWKTVEHLENRAKKAVWKYVNVELKKDTIVISKSRSEVITMLPLSMFTSLGFKCLADELRDYIVSLQLLLVLGALSANIPEDFERFVSGALDVLSQRPPDLLHIVKHVISRNVQMNKEVLRVVQTPLEGRALLKNLFSETQMFQQSKTSPLIIELFNLIKVLRGVS